MHLRQGELPPGVMVARSAGSGGGLAWIDLVTGTRWEADPGAFRAGVRKALHLVRDPGPAGPVLNLPWLPAGDRPWRLADQAHVFAALYFAISPAARSAWASERATARAAAIAPPDERAGMSLAERGAAEACLAALEGRPVGALRDRRFDVVRGGVVRVQQYVLESDWLPGLRGASALLLRVEEELPSCLPAEDCVIFAGGGHILAVVPEGEGPAAAAAVEGLIRRRTVTARAAAAYVTADLGAVRGDGFRNLQRRLEFEWTRRQHTGLPETLSGAHDPDPLPEDAGLRPWIGADQECMRCLLRPARYVEHVGGVARRLCESCARKRVAANEQARDLRGRFRRSTGKALAPAATLEDVAGPPGSGTGRYLGLLYGDGNGVGGRIATLTSLPAYRCFSHRLAEGSEQAVFQALERCNPGLQAELVVLGGDDVRLFVPAPVAWAVANAVVANFEEAFRNRTTGAPAMTMAMGVAIGHYKTPLALQHEVVRELLGSAKARAKDQPGHPVSAVDVAVLDSFESYAGGLHLFRQRALRRSVRSGAGTLRLTGRPFTLPQSEGLRRAVLGLTRGASNRHHAQLHLLADALLADTDPDEVDLFLLYQLARAEDDWRAALSQALRSVAEVFAGPAGVGATPSVFVAGDRPGARFESPWLDVLELLEFSAGGEEP